MMCLQLLQKNKFQKIDPTVSLSYWMGQLLTEKLLAGKRGLGSRAPETLSELANTD
jgi:hypothetical protein